MRSFLLNYHQLLVGFFQRHSMVIVVHNMKYGAKILYIYDIHKFCNYFLNKFEKKSQQLEIQRTNSYIQLLHFLQQFAGGHLHAVEGEPLLA